MIHSLFEVLFLHVSGYFLVTVFLFFPDLDHIDKVSCMGVRGTRRRKLLSNIVSGIHFFDRGRASLMSVCFVTTFFLSFFLFFIDKGLFIVNEL